MVTNKHSKIDQVLIILIAIAAGSVVAAVLTQSYLIIGIGAVFGGVLGYFCRND